MTIQGCEYLHFQQVNEKRDLEICLHGLVTDAEKIRGYAYLAYNAKDKEGFEKEREKFLSLSNQIDIHFNYYLDANLLADLKKDETFLKFAIVNYFSKETMDRILSQGFELTDDLLLDMINERPLFFIACLPRLHALGLSREVKDKLLTAILSNERIPWEKRKELTKEMIQLGANIQNPHVPSQAVRNNDSEFLQFFIDQGGDLGLADSLKPPLLIHNLYRRYVRPDAESETIQDLLLASDALFILSFFWSASPKTLEKILPRLVEADLKKIITQFFSNRGREDTLPLLKKAGLFDSLDEKRQSELLQLGISNLQTEKVKFLIGQGWRIKDEHIKAALETCHLEMIDCLQLRETFKEHLLSQKDKIKDLIENLLFYSPELMQTREFLNSLKKEASELKSIIEQTEERVIRLMPLCSRWTLRHEKEEVFFVYKEIPNPTPEQLSTFVQEQLEYAESCWKSIEAMKEEGLAGKTLMDQIGFFMKERVKIASQQRGVKEDDPFSQFRTLSRPYETDISSYHPDSSRYDFVISELREVQNSCVKGFQPRSDGGYDLTYPDPQTGTPLVVNTVCLIPIRLPGAQPGSLIWKWQNCSGEMAHRLWPHLEKMHATLSTMKVDPNNQEEMGSFHELFAEAYWLGCILNITRRGNAQHFLNWLYHQRTSHGLLPLIPKTKYPLPDCMAMTLPLETFKTRFLTLFEPSSQESTI